MKIKAQELSVREADSIRDKALEEKQVAEEIARTFEETVKSLRRQMLDEKA